MGENTSQAAASPSSLFSGSRAAAAACCRGASQGSSLQRAVVSCAALRTIDTPMSLFQFATTTKNNTHTRLIAATALHYYSLVGGAKALFT